MDRLPPEYELARTLDYILELGSPWVRIVDSWDAENVPADWSRFSRMAVDEFVESLWGGADGPFPEFSEFLRAHLRTLFLGRGDYGPLLVYFLEGVIRFDDQDFLDGILIGGRPAPVQAAETSLGALPESYRLLRSNHGFFVARNGAVVRGPELVGVCAGDSWRPNSLECLSIADCGNGRVGCLTRSIGSRAWQDLVAVVEPAAKRGSFVDLSSLDQFLVKEF